MKRKKIGKKADLPSAWTVTIIVLIIGFAILLIFFVRFLWQERIDTETCHQSVIFRGTASALSSAAESYIPLKCHEAKLCITTGGKCEDTYGENAEGVTKIKVSNLLQVEKAIAGEIIDCWTMMGEGKLSLFTQYMAKNFGFGKISSSCVICSRIAFDKSLESSEIDLTKLDIESYMHDYKAPEQDVSYLDYIAGENGKIKISLDNDIEEIANPLSQVVVTGKPGEEISSLDSKMNNEITLEPGTSAGKREFAVMFMQVIAPQGTDVLKNSAYAIMGGAGATGVVATTLTIKTITTAAFWKVTLPILALVGIGQQINVILNRNFAAGHCSDSVVGGSQYDGCSVVRTINYDMIDIAKYCSVIESIP